MSNSEYLESKVKLLECRVKHNNILVDSYKLMYSIQDSVIKSKGYLLQDDVKDLYAKLSRLERGINLIYEGLK